MSEKDNAELILDLIKAVEERDAERLFANYHDDVEFHDASSLPYGGSYYGKAEIVARFEEDPEDTLAGHLGAATAHRFRAPDGCAHRCRIGR